MVDVVANHMVCSVKCDPELCCSNTSEGLCWYWQQRGLQCLQSIQLIILLPLLLFDQQLR